MIERVTTYMIIHVRSDRTVYCFHHLKTVNCSVCQRGSNFDKVFFVDEGWDDPNTTICEPSSARQRNAIYMAFRWRDDDGPTLNAGSVAL